MAAGRIAHTLQTELTDYQVGDHSTINVQNFDHQNHTQPRELMTQFNSTFLNPQGSINPDPHSTLRSNRNSLMAHTIQGN